MTSTSHDSRTCQVCGERFDSITDKGIHVSTAHDLGRSGRDRTRKFIACRCGTRTYLGMACETCGTIVEPPAWSEITRIDRISSERLSNRPESD